MMINDKCLKYYSEPQIEFGYCQHTDDSRDGLTLFGPYSRAIGEARIGIIGTQKGIEAYSVFCNEINRPIYTKTAGRPFFPGFQTLFDLKWPSEPTACILLDSNDLDKKLKIKNLHERTYQLVSVYLSKIKRYIQFEEGQIDLWYLVIPREIWSLCRPKSNSGKSTFSKMRVGKYLEGQMSVFPDEDKQIGDYVKMYEADSDFHDQLKARLLSEKIQSPVQIVIDDTLCFKSKDGKKYDDEMKAHLMWTISTSTFYKLGYLLWKLFNVRERVCYIGLVFKTLQDFQQRKGYACCAAQMFLDSGDGMVFRGNIGPWLSKNEKTYHLNTESAKDLIKTAIDTYYENNGVYPKELFIHGRTRFTDEEWDGFSEAISGCPETNLVGITINEFDGLRLLKDNSTQNGKYGILRGMALIVDSRNGYLWTKGYIPRIETANHMEVARPLRITISRGDCDIDTVMQDILCLTKLNYNACIYGDGLPVTLRFSDKIGNILTALKDVNWPARQFKYYI